MNEKKMVEVIKKAESAIKDCHNRHSALEIACHQFARAWCEWHKHHGFTLDVELVDAGHAIVGSLGLELDDSDGEFTLRPIQAKEPLVELAAE